MLFGEVNQPREDERDLLLNGLLTTPDQAVMKKIPPKKESELDVFARDSMNGWVLW
jgi:hypothetical protein